jgi:glycosyltransferase involved in cell wall biosynthesis
VPVYEAEDFIAETLTAVEHQPHARLPVLVSVDASSDGTAEVSRQFEHDRRFTVHVQPERLGWIANINVLLDRVETDFFFIMPHDDLIEPGYVKALRRAARRARTRLPRTATWSRPGP